jgi:uncharacterized membrane protein YccC
MRRSVFVTLPMRLPRLSDKAAAQLLDILSQLLESVQHHYGSQARRWQHQQSRLHTQASSAQTSSPRFDDEHPF